MRSWLPLGLLLVATVARAEVRLDRVTRLDDGGRGVRYQQTWHGLDVVGGMVYVRSDGRGLVRWSSGAAQPIPDDLDDQPVLDARQAAAAVGRDVVGEARLVVFAPAGKPARLAWRVILPGDLGGRPGLRATLDATTGRPLGYARLVMYDRQAKVFATNPVASSSLSTVQLDVPSGSTKLANADFVAMNCVDRMSCPIKISGTQNARWCEIQTKVAAGASGDFMYDRPSSDGATEDEFAEVQMFYHATVGLTAFRALGFDRLGAAPMQAIVNLRRPEDVVALCAGASSTVKLVPHENAFFAPRGAFIPGVFPQDDAIVFGQGADVDYSYDGDVIYHELTHAVMSRITDLNTANIDETGFDPSLFAMHEGFADTFAAIIAGDPNIAEYIGPAFNGGEAGPLRSLQNERKCPEHLVGEEHSDSEMWSAAMWDIREQLPALQQPMFDQALYTVVDSMGAVETFDTTQAKIVSELETRLGATVAASARTVFATRGLDGCNGRVVDVALGTPRPGLYLSGPSDFPGLDKVPGPVQLKLTLTKEAKEVRVTADASTAADGSDDGNPEIQLVLKAGAPIVWDADNDRDDGTARGDVVVTTTGNKKASGSVVGTFPPGVYYALFTNAGDSWVLAKVRISAADDSGGGGGGCAVGGGGGGAAWLIALALAWLLRARFGRVSEST